MTNEEKIDYLYTKFISISGSGESTFNSQIWRDSQQIPFTIPTFDGNGLYKDTNGQDILKRVTYAKMERISDSIDAYSSDIVSDVVSYESGFDVSYELSFFKKTYDGSFIKIPFSAEDKFFDPTTGILLILSRNNRLYDSRNIYISCIMYVGRKGLDVQSQFTSYPTLGPTGPTGPTGITGETGPTKEFSMRYKESWNSYTEYEKWEIVEYDDKYYISTVDFNSYPPTVPIYWQPFGIQQVRESFSYPDNTLYVSPSFPNTGVLFSGLEQALDAINNDNRTITTIIVYTGDYTINNTLTMDGGIKLNVFFVGKSTITFSSPTAAINFSAGSVIEFRGVSFSFQNGIIGLSKSSLKCTGGKVHNIEMTTTDSAEVSRLLLADSTVNNIESYASYVSLVRTSIQGKITMDELSTVHVESCWTENPETGNEIVEIITQVASGVPSGFGMDYPALMIKNSRLVTDDSSAIVYTGGTSPLYGLKIGIIKSSLFVGDQSVSVSDYDYSVETLVYDIAYNTSFDQNGIISISGQNKYVNSLF